MLSLKTIEKTLRTTYHYEDVVNHYMERLKALTKGEWIEVGNKDFEDFSICMDLHLFNLIGKQTIPKWKDGSFIGTKILFKIEYEE